MHCPQYPDCQGFVRAAGRLAARVSLAGGLALAAILAAEVSDGGVGSRAVAQQADTPGSPGRTADPAADCATALDRFDALNAFQLFGGATACAHAGAATDANLLLIATQVRAATDLTLLAAATEADQAAAAQLARLVYTQAAGPGNPVVYRDPDASRALLGRLDAWHPQLSESYSPGWAVAPGDRREAYATYARRSVEAQLVQLRAHVRRVRRNQLAAIAFEIDSLTKGEDGRQDAARRDRLAELMDRKAALERFLAEP